MITSRRYFARWLVLDRLCAGLEASLRSASKDGWTVLAVLADRSVVLYRYEKEVTE